VEEVVSPVWCVLQVRVPFDGGARWSSVVVRLLPPYSRFGGIVWCGDPRPGPAWRRIWGVKILKTAVRCFATELMVQGVTPSGAVSGDFPAAMGLPSSILGVWTSSGSGASLSRSGRRQSWSSEGLRCNFFFLGFSVRSEHL
jgi:hypothetical protein